MCQISSEIQIQQGQQLDRIIMVNLSDDLTPIAQDESEDLLRGMLES